MVDRAGPKDDAGEIAGLRERVRALEAERDASERDLAAYRALVDNLPIGLYTLSDPRKGTLSYANPALLEMFGYASADQVVGTSTFLRYRDPEDRVRLMKAVRDSQLRDSNVARFEVELLRADNREPVLCSFTITAAFDENGDWARVDGAVEDVTVRRRAERALHESDERFRLFFESSAIGMVMSGPDRRILRANPAFCRFVGHDEADLQERTFLDITHPDDREESRRMVADAAAGRIETFRLEKRYLHADGSVRWGRTTSTFLRRASGRPIHSVAIVEDITDRRRLEEELLQVEKLRSLSVLSGRIAHDFNNFLTGVLGNISVARAHVDARVDADGSLCEALGAAEKAAVRARDLTRQLQTFSRGGAPLKEPRDLMGLILEAASFCLRGSHASWSATAAPDVPSVACDAGQISQVFNNILMNAAQSMTDGGHVRIVVEPVALGDGSRLPLRPGRYVRARVVDDGAGIQERHLPRIFDPFWSTRAQGSGLGLASAWSIVKKHDGHIDVSSRAGLGTTVDVYLPASDVSSKGAVEAEIASRGGTAWRAGTGRVLVMDDEPDVREVAERILARGGYEVVTVDDGDAALSAWSAAGAAGRPFAAAVLDLTVPGGRGGDDVIGEILALDPGARAIVSSGYSTSPVTTNHRAWGFAGCLPKPYTAAQLLSAVSEVIGPSDDDRPGVPSSGALPVPRGPGG